MRPTIKGIFVKSHLRALRRARGESAIVELGARYGKSIDFSDMEDVPVAEEVRLLEHIADIRSVQKLSAAEREVEAGRLHFSDFTTTPLWKVIEPLFKRNQKKLLMQTGSIAARVFKGIIFMPEDLGSCTVKITLKNNDYPLEHFQGFFEAWIAAAGLRGSVEAVDMHNNAYEYIVTWV
jgi:uncharacterized protein (TIGR02265 family)